MSDIGWIWAGLALLIILGLHVLGFALANMASKETPMPGKGEKLEQRRADTNCDCPEENLVLRGSTVRVLDQMRMGYLVAQCAVCTRHYRYEIGDCFVLGKRREIRFKKSGLPGDR